MENMGQNSEEGEYRQRLWQLYKDAVLGRLKILPVISSLSASLLIIATFNPNLIPLNNFVRVLLSFLLLLIPIPIYLYLKELNEGGLEAKKAMEENLKIGLKESGKKMNAYFPWIACAVISIVIVLMIVIIWYNALNI